MAPLKRQLAAVAALVAAATSVSPSHAISGGTPTTGSPAVGALLPAFGGHRLCTGTLVGCRSFLTAAHCLYKDDLLQITSRDKYKVYFQHAGLFTVKRVTPHRDYVRASEFPDLALVQLSRDVTGIKPDRLLGLAELTRMKQKAGTPDEPHFPYRVSARIVGFGYTGRSADEPESEPPRGVKRVGCISTAKCVSDARAESHVCSRPPAECKMLPDGDSILGANTCGGDSGGPVFIDVDGVPLLAGIISGGVRKNCADSNDKPYNTNVAPFRDDWIRELAGDDMDRYSCGEGDGVDYGSLSDIGREVTVGPAQPEMTAESDLVTAGVKLLRIGINGEDDGHLEYDYAIQPPDGAPMPACDVSKDGPDRYRQFAFCEIVSPAPGAWSVRVKQTDGSKNAMVQVVFTTFR